MKSTHKLLCLTLLLVLGLLPAGPVQAKGFSDGKVVFGDDFTLEKGETLDGDLAVIGGDVSIEEGAIVEGSLAVIGGDAVVSADAVINGDVALIGGRMQIEGSVVGDVAIIGGQISLGELAVIDGDVATIGGQLEQSPGATITGDVVDNPSPSIDIPLQPNAPDMPNMPNWSEPWIYVEANPVWDFANVFFQALGVGLIATLAALFLQPQLERVGQVIASQPIIAGSFGFLAVVVGPLALLTLAITIVLIPVSFIGVVALVLAWLFGIIAIGQEVGERFTRAFSQTWAPPLTTGFGSFLLMLVGGYIGLIPCVGWLAPFLIGLLGLGGTALTLFGTRTYPRVAALPPAA